MLLIHTVKQQRTEIIEQSNNEIRKLFDKVEWNNGVGFD